MAKSQPSAEPKAPLIVALAFFVLASLVLGVLYYLETDKKASAVAEAKKANDEKSNADKLRSEEQDKVRLYRVALGVNEAPEAEELKNTRNEAKVKEEFQKLTTALTSQISKLTDNNSSKVAGSEAAKGRPFSESIGQVLKWRALEEGKLDRPPERTIADAVVTAVVNQLLAEGRERSAVKSQEEAQKSYQTQAAAADAAKKGLEQLIEQEKKNASELQDKLAKKEAETRSLFAAKTSDYTKAEDRLQEDLRTRNIALEAAKEKERGQQKQLEVLTEQADAREDPFRYTKPLGKIIRRERGTDTVYIDLGSADNVPVGLRLTVQPSNTPEAGTASRLRPRLGPTGRPVTENGQPVYDMVPKGKLEVVAVEGPSLARCRITSETDRVRERIEYGDLLYNASWRRGKTDTIVLYGVFDNNADGTDDVRQVIGDLRRMNITVAAYFDLAQRKWVDPTTGRPTAVTEQVVYAVEGAYPVGRAGDDPLAAARDELSNALNAAKKQVLERGVKLVKARVYFPNVGYEYRGADASVDRISQAYNQYLRTAPPPDAPTEPK